MCRILVTDNKENLKVAENILKLGGPDEQNLMLYDDISYYHTRLTIQGTSKGSGKQPMTSKDLIFLYNGEIYNKKGLELKYLDGRIFKSDTELIFELITNFGLKILSELEGMFALVIKIKGESGYYLARDIFGKKPLYLKNSKKNWFISSQYDWYSKEIDSNREIFNVFGFYPEPYTAYEDVEAIEPGYVLKFVPGKELKKIYSLSNNNTRFDLKDSLISDVKIALAYSGGVDSSILSNLYKDQSIEHLSIGKLKENDSKKNNPILLSKKKYDSCRKEWKALPGFNFSIDGFNIYTLSKISRERGYKVIITGTGGDELFSGYKQHKYFILLHLLSYFPPIILKVLSKKSGRFGRLDWLLEKRIKRKMRVYLSVKAIQRKKEVSLNKDLLYKINSIYEKRTKFFVRLGRERVFANLEMSIFLKSRLLRDSDYYSMMNGIEIRSPFLNQAVLNKINSNILLNSTILPNKLGSVVLFKTFRVLPRVFMKKEGFFIYTGINKKRSLL